MKTENQNQDAETLESYKTQVIETMRQSMGIRRQFPGQCVRWKRLAKTGPRAESIMLLRIGINGTVAEIVPRWQLQAWASTVSDEEVAHEFLKRSGALGED